MSVKLYIFDSVDDAGRFEQGTTIHVDPIADSISPANVAPKIEREQELRFVRRKIARKIANPKREAAKERILEKAKAKKIVRHCKKCGEPGHRSDTCPNPGAIGNALDDDQIAYIKEQAEAGVSVDQIAQETGLPERIVRRYW
jgi:CO dehydrogenase/acetyl-CoA synthase alpha subunit